MTAAYFAHLVPITLLFSISPALIKDGVHRLGDIGGWDTLWSQPQSSCLPNHDRAMRVSKGAASAWWGDYYAWHPDGILDDADFVGCSLEASLGGLCCGIPLLGLGFIEPVPRIPKVRFPTFSVILATPDP